MIKLQMIGNLGRDCTVNNVNGRTVINFSVAHTERYRDSTSGEMKPRTTWVECAYWTDKPAIAPYLKKGSLVYVEGTPDTRSYVSQQDGAQKTSLTLRIQNIQLLLSKNDDNPSNNLSANNNDSANSENSQEENSDDLPF